jgi:SOS response regulatory protein OraA/RecX
VTDIDRPEGRLATVTAFPGTFDPTDTETDDNPESAGELAKRAENIAMYALTRRAVSIREMEKLLKSRDLPDDVVATEIARLEGVGLLDDYALAADLARELLLDVDDGARQRGRRPRGREQARRLQPIRMVHHVRHAQLRALLRPRQAAAQHQHARGQLRLPGAALRLHRV